MKNHIEQMRKAAEDLLAQIDLQTDCMSNQIDREALDQHMDALESALDYGIGKMPFNVQELRPEVLAIALLMEARLREKDADKGTTWKNMGRRDLYVQAATKLMLIERALIVADGTDAGHAVDLANYCMMIADVAGALQKPEPEARNENGGAGWAGIDHVRSGPAEVSPDRMQGLDAARARGDGIY